MPSTCWPRRTRRPTRRTGRPCSRTSHPASSVAAHGGQKQHIATGFFYNPNDLATFIAICWPFLVMGLLVTRRKAFVALDLVFMAIGLYALLHTGSRSSLIAIGLTTLLVAGIVVHRRWTRHRGLVVGATVALLAAAAFLAFNPAQSGILTQFQVSSLAATDTQGATEGSSSATRLALTRAGFHVGADYLFLGAGPGNAEGLVGRQPDAPESVTSLHDWWLEVFVDGGLPALVLSVLLYVGLLVVSWRVSRRAHDRFLCALAAAVTVSLLGYVVGSLGPSTVVSFAPMWILFGLGLAVARRAHFERLEEQALSGETSAVAASSAGTTRAVAS